MTESEIPAALRKPPHRARWVVLCITIATIALLVSLAFGLIRRRPPITSLLAGQSNLRMTFYGRAVDEHDKSLAGVKFEFQIEAYPADWTFETRGRDYVRSNVSVVSDVKGNFQFDLEGSMLRLSAASIGDYRELFDLESSTRAEDGGNSVYTRAIHLMSWGDQHYRSDPERPAVFVFVSPGARTTAALPSQGGDRSPGGILWTVNRPAWPHTPSLDDVDWVNGRPRRNTTVPLVFKVLDTKAHAMAGVQIAYEIERFRTLQEMRSDHYAPHTRTALDRGLVTTADDGTARATANGFRLKSIYNVQLKGMPWEEGPFPIRGADNSYYVREFLSTSGDLIFRCDDESPITLVMTHRGEQVTHVLPSRGGYEKHGDSWRRIEPALPEGIARPMKYLPQGAATVPATPATTRVSE